MAWIDASVELPRHTRPVLVAAQLVDGGRLWRAVAEYVAPRTLLAEDHCDPDCDADWFDVDENGVEWAPAGWYEAPVTLDYSHFMGAGRVLYWCELPDLPEAD